jgi:hypothetical protein
VITLQFCRFPGLGDAAIRWFCQGTVAHVDAVLPDGRLLGAQMASGLGAKPSGVHIRPAGYGDMSGMKRVSIDATEAQECMFYNFLFDQLWKPYDRMSILGLIAGRDWHEEDSWICSELQAAALEKAQIFPHMLDVPVNKITPPSLHLLCSAFGETETM